MKPLSANPAESSATLEDRLERLCAALHELPEAGRRPAEHHATRILLSIDDIVGRVRTLALLLEENGNSERWDLVDHAAAQMLLRDLAIIARDLRSVAAIAASDFAAVEDQVRNADRLLSSVATRIERFVDPDAKLTPDAT